MKNSDDNFLLIAGPMPIGVVMFSVQRVVNVGDDVIMTCEWDVENNFTKNITYQYRPDLETEKVVPIWTFRGDASNGYNMPLNKYDARIEAVTVGDYAFSHSIRLLSVTDEDKGYYNCRVTMYDIKHNTLYKQMAVEGRHYAFP